MQQIGRLLQERVGIHFLSDRGTGQRYPDDMYTILSFYSEGQASLSDKHIQAYRPRRAQKLNRALLMPRLAPIQRRLRQEYPLSGCDQNISLASSTFIPRSDIISCSYYLNLLHSKHTSRCWKSRGWHGCMMRYQEQHEQIVPELSYAIKGFLIFSFSQTFETETTHNNGKGRIMLCYINY